MIVRLCALPLVFLLGATVFLMAACTHEASLPGDAGSDFSGTIHLYGEQHGVASIIDNEYELWLAYYNKRNMRHLFIEMPYYSAEFLNVWMKSDDDTILDELFIDIAGCSANTPEDKIFFQKIKKNAPETVFHGTDVGHQAETTGKRYLKYLEQNGRKNSRQYQIAQDNIEQGKKYYGFFGKNVDYREDMMVENFVRELKSIDPQDIMGIYGSAHTAKRARFCNGRIDNMATRLSARSYNVNTYRLAPATQLDAVERLEPVVIDGREFIAVRIGSQDMSSWNKNYASREYWRVDNAYDSVKDNRITGEVLPYDNYPVEINVGDVFMVKYVKPDGVVDIVFYRADGNAWNNRPVTERFDETLDR